MHWKHILCIRVLQKIFHAKWLIHPKFWIKRHKCQVDVFLCKFFNLVLIIDIHNAIDKFPCSIPFPVVEIPGMIKTCPVCLHIKGDSRVRGAQRLNLQVIHLIFFARTNVCDQFPDRQVKPVFFQKMRWHPAVFWENIMYVAVTLCPVEHIHVKMISVFVACKHINRGIRLILRDLSTERIAVHPVSRKPVKNQNLLIHFH